MKSPRAMHIAASAAYIVLAMTVAGVLAPPEMLPNIDLPSPNLVSAAKEIVGLGPETSDPDADGDRSSASSDFSNPDEAAGGGPGSSAQPPFPPIPTTFAPGTGPVAPECVSGEGVCSAAETLALLTIPGSPEVTSTPPVDDPSTTPEDVAPTDEASQEPAPTPSEEPTSSDEPTTGTDDPGTDDPGTDGPGTTDPAPTDPTDDPSSEPSDPADGGDGEGEPTPGVSPEADPSPSPGPSPSPSPSPNASPNASPEPSPSGSPTENSEASPESTPQSQQGAPDDASEGVADPTPPTGE